MGPRPFGRGRRGRRRGERSGLRLQWGRDLSAAEGRRDDHTRTISHGLQWGRDLSAAEGNGAPLMPVHNSWRLQWGRDLSAAEGRVRVSLTGRVICFNGAATFRPRKGHAARLFSRSRCSFNGAATFRPRKGIRFRPRHSRGRGLQWGRDLSAAEGVRAPLERPELQGGFNGAATFRPRKVLRAGCALHSEECFNGAATFRPRKVKKAIDLRAGLLCFNGAATFRPRKVGIASRRRRAPRAASMGPRPFGRGRQF